MCCQIDIAIVSEDCFLLFCCTVRVDLLWNPPKSESAFQVKLVLLRKLNLPAWCLNHPPPPLPAPFCNKCFCFEVWRPCAVLLTWAAKGFKPRFSKNNGLVAQTHSRSLLPGPFFWMTVLLEKLSLALPQSPNFLGGGGAEGRRGRCPPLSCSVGGQQQVLEGPLGLGWSSSFVGKTSITQTNPPNKQQWKKESYLLKGMRGLLSKSFLFLSQAQN